ncbi:hypothetical protein SB751_32640, partial [Cupriavidus sp. SIMBA_020]|uniref:hypothetical protein n=1 Tax=Cupriavidus sp. SIMBA_020 TaxID=3085766 RepID=UPI00397C3CB5
APKPARPFCVAAVESAAAAFCPPKGQTISATIKKKNNKTDRQSNARPPHVASGIIARGR